MENRTNFNLGENIGNWKSELNRNGNMTRDNIDELESHLEDEIHELQKLGLNREESFLVAKNRLGNPEKLSNEFSKVNKKISLRNKFLPYLKGILLYFAFSNIIYLITIFSVFIANKRGLINLNLLSIGLLTLLTFIVLVGFYINYKKENTILRKLTSTPVLVSLTIISEVLIFLSNRGRLLFDSIKTSDFMSISFNFNIYLLLIVLFIIVLSCIFFYSSKKASKIKVAE